LLSSYGSASEVVELLLAVGPLDVLVGAEDDAVVVLGWGARIEAWALPPSVAALCAEVPAVIGGGCGATVFLDIVGFDVGLEEDRPARAEFGVVGEWVERATVDRAVGAGVGEFEDRRGDVDGRGRLVGFRARLDPRAANQEGQVGRGLKARNLPPTKRCWP
jgi:hypothetical protein